MKISRRKATIGGLSLLAGTSINASAQATLRNAIENAKERELGRELVSRTVLAAPLMLSSGACPSSA